MANSTSNSPGVFRGNARLASQQDLAILRQELSNYPLKTVLWF